MLQLAVRLLLADKLSAQLRLHGKSSGSAFEDQPAKNPQKPVRLEDAFLQDIPDSLEIFTREVLCMAYVESGSRIAKDANHPGDELSSQSVRRLLVRNAQALLHAEADHPDILARELEEWSRSLVGNTDSHWKQLRAALLASLLNPALSDCYLRRAPKSSKKICRNKHIICASIETLAKHGRNKIIQEAWNLHSAKSISGKLSSFDEGSVSPGNFDSLLRKASVIDELAMRQFHSIDEPSIVNSANWFGNEMHDVLAGVIHFNVHQRLRS